MKVVISHKRIININELISFLVEQADGTYTLKLQGVGSPLDTIKKKYHAMVDELAFHAGYHSRSDKNLFKTQIKEQLGNESIAEMNDPLQVQIKIEELHELANNHYSYIFKPFEK